MYYAEHEKEKEELEALDSLVAFTEESDGIRSVPSPWRIQPRPGGEFAGAGIDPSPWLLQRRGLSLTMAR